MTIIIILISILITMLALIMVAFGVNLITITAIGGIIASGFWIVHVYNLGIKERPYEFFAAFTWFIFSAMVFLYEY